MKAAYIRSCLLVLLCLLASCASMVTTTQYKPYSGGKIISGSGGTKRTVEGIDIWEHGEPDRQFRIVGIIEDDLLENRGAAPGTLNILNVATTVSLAKRDKRLAQTARQHGADAIVAINSERSFLNAGAYETNFKNRMIVAAVKYVDTAALPQYGMRRTRESIEAELGSGEEIPIQKVGITVPSSATDVKAVRYRSGPIGVILVYDSNLSEAAVIAHEAGAPFPDAQISKILHFFSDGQNWQPLNSSVPHYKLHWLRADGLYYAFANTDPGIFVIANRSKYPYD